LDPVLTVTAFSLYHYEVDLLPESVAGSRLFGDEKCDFLKFCFADEKEAQSFNDGKLEVLALYSSWHMGQLRLGWSKPHCVGQAETIEVKCLKKRQSKYLEWKDAEQSLCFRSV